MKNIKIILPYDCVDQEEIVNAIKAVKGTSVSFDDVSNITGELICTILSSTLTFTSIALELAKLKGFLEERCVIVDVEGNVLKSDVRIKDLEKININALCAQTNI